LRAIYIAWGVVTHPFDMLAWSARPYVGRWGPILPAAAMVVAGVTKVECCYSVTRAQTTLVQWNPGILGTARKL
jgi:hypothetical protein